MSEIHDEPGHDQAFAQGLLEHLREVFWEPEIARRGGIEVTGEIRAALAVLRPGKPLDIRLNSEADLAISAVATRACH